MNFKICISGTSPEAAGCDAFVKLIGPALKAAAGEFDALELARFYCGIFSAFAGTLAADFSPREAAALLSSMHESTQQTIKQLETMGTVQ